MPGQYYVYIPFAPDHEGDLGEGLRGWRQQMNGVGRKMPLRLQHGVGARPLAGLAGLAPDSYTLYVMGHGNIGRRNIANTRIIFLNTRETIGPGPLAAQMQADGLPHDVRNLKLWACYGGVTFGRYFYHALITRGFNRVVLSAYTLPLHAMPGLDGHKRALDPETGAISRPSAVRVQWPR